jgi:hypothetical protein
MEADLALGMDMRNLHGHPNIQIKSAECHHNKAVLLLAMQELKGRGNVVPTHS